MTKHFKYPLGLLLVGLLVVSSAAALPFNQDMVGTQLSVGDIQRPEPENAIPRGSLKRNVVNTPEEALALQNPVENTEQSLFNGKRLYAVNCSPCHGRYMEKENTLTFVPGAVSKYLPGPRLDMAYMKDKPDGHFFRYIYFGGLAIMPAYGWRFSVEEHWDIINFIRHVQDMNIGN